VLYALVGRGGGARARGTPADNSCAPPGHGGGPPPRPRTCDDLQSHVTAVFQDVCCEGKFFCCADPARMNDMFEPAFAGLCRIRVPINSREKRPDEGNGFLQSQIHNDFDFI